MARSKQTRQRRPPRPDINPGTSNQEPSSDLCSWVLNTLFARWAQNRRPLEDKWEKNRCAYGRDPRLDDLRPTWKKKERSAKWKSTTVTDLTKSKVVSAKNIVKDVMMPGNRLAFMLLRDDQAHTGEAGNAAVADVAAAAIDENERLMQRQFTFGCAPRTLERLILSGAIYGLAWSRRRVDEMEDESYTDLSGGEFELLKTKTDMLAFDDVSVWNMFTDLEDPNVHTNTGVIERKYFSPYELRKLKGKPYYFDEEIETVIRASSSLTDDARPFPESVPNAKDEPRRREITQFGKTIIGYIFYGRVPRIKITSFIEAMEKRNIKIVGGPPTAADQLGDELECHLIIAKNRVIRFALTTPEQRAYDCVIWEDSLDSIYPWSVADNVEPEQLSINGAWRTFENNLKLLSNFMLAIKQEYLEGDWDQTLEEGKPLAISEDCDDVRKAVQQLKLDAGVLEPLMKAIEMLLNFGDSASMIPRVEQGQGNFDANTAFELRQRLESAGKYLASVVCNYDKWVETSAGAQYRYNMRNPQLGIAKIPAKVVALGFTSFQNRVVRANDIKWLLQLMLANPDVKERGKLQWLLDELTKSMDIDPDQVWYSAREMQQQAAGKQAQLDQMNQNGAAAKDPATAALLQAQIQKLQAEATQKLADARLKGVVAVEKTGKLAIDRARAVSDLRGQRAAVGDQPAEARVQQSAVSGQMEAGAARTERTQPTSTALPGAGGPTPGAGTPPAAAVPELPATAPMPALTPQEQAGGTPGMGGTENPPA